MHLTTLLYLLILSNPLWPIDSAEERPSPPVLLPDSVTLLSLDDVLNIALTSNRSIQVAREAIESSKAEQKQLNALWFPTIAATTKYTHTTSPIGLETTLGEVAEGLLPTLGPLVAANPTLAPLIESATKSTIGLSAVPRNTLSLGADLTWPIFSGGKRLAASKIGSSIVDAGLVQHEATTHKVIAEVTTAYLSLSLAESILQLRRESHAALSTHLRDALRLEEEGFITTAERLVAEVNEEEARVAVEVAKEDVGMARKRLHTLLGGGFNATLITTSSISPPNSIPPLTQLLEQLPSSPTMELTNIEQSIATLNLSIEQSRYLPDVALLGHYRLWSKGLDSSIFPRGFVGIGLSWTLFDGLAREGAIGSARSRIRTIQTSKLQLQDELTLLAERLYTSILNATSELASRKKSIFLAEELLRVRHLAFAEGMATSVEVVDAALLLSEARIGHLVALYTINTSLATLLAICGDSTSITNYLSTP